MESRARVHELDLSIFENSALAVTVHNDGMPLCVLEL